jgi:putative FmdB family regulatory protein
VSLRLGILGAMASYEYVCLACERVFEDRRPMSVAVDTALACPSCGAERIRRRFSFLAARPPAGTAGSAGGCGCGGACACGG